MRRIRFFLLLTGLLLSINVFAQPIAEQYDAAAAAYQSGNFSQAEDIWTALAEQGDANSQYAMGIMHLKKEARRSQDGVAFRYLVDAAKKQHVAAMFNLGVAYWEGRGVNRQPAKALNWWEVAAQRQDAGAQYNLGLAYYIGEGRAQNTEKALYWVKKAAENGHPQAKALLKSIQKNPTPQINEPGQASQTVAVKQASGKKKQPSTAPPKIAKKTPAAAVIRKVPEKQLQLEGSQIRLIKTLSTLRATPDVQGASLASLKPGTSIRVIKPGKIWSQVMVARSYPVWVYETFLIDKGQGAGTIKGNTVNIRPRPSTDKALSPALGQLNEGDSVSIVLKRSPWVQIIPSQPLPAWIASKDIE